MRPLCFVRRCERASPFVRRTVVQDDDDDDDVDDAGLGCTDRTNVEDARTMPGWDDARVSRVVVVVVVRARGRE